MSNGLNHVLVKQNIMKCVHTHTQTIFISDADVKIPQSSLTVHSLVRIIF